MHKKYRYLFFDLDRTLWDYDRNASETLFQIYHQHNLKDSDIEFEKFSSSFTRHNDDLWNDYREGRVHKDVLRTLRFERALADCGLHNPILAARLNNDFLEICPRKPGLVSGAIELIELLSAKQYNLYIITNGFTKIQMVKMEVSGLGRYFHKVFTSENCGSNKPNRKIFEHAITAVNARKTESLMIGDDLVADITGARNFGIDQVYYNPQKRAHNEPTTYEITGLPEIVSILG